MKTFFFFILMTLETAALAAPFGSLVESYRVGSSDYKSTYLIDKIANGTPVSICVDGRLDQYSLSAKKIDAALNSWFKYAYQSVVNAKRQREFGDLLPLLSQGAKIRIQNCSDNAAFKREFAAQIANGSGAEGYEYASSREDLRIVLVNSKDVPEGRSYFSQGKGDTVSYIIWNVEDLRGEDGLNAVRHELGHALSLSDQYQEGRANSVPEYGTSDTMPSMMTDAKKFTCDDADAIIFTLDCIAEKNTSRGGAEGWRSFCPQRAGRNYAYCKTKNREDLLWVSDKGVRYVRYDRNGNVTEHKEWARLRDSRLFTLFPQGIPPLPANLQTVYKGKYVSYKKDNRAEYLFSTRPESEGSVPVQPGQTLIVRADPNYSVVLVKSKDSVFVPLGTAEGSEDLSFTKNGVNISAKTFLKASGQDGIQTELFYTPQARFEYYERGAEGMVALAFPKDSSVFYIFFTADGSSNKRMLRGAKADLPAAGDENSAFNIRAVTEEEAAPFIGWLNGAKGSFGFDRKASLPTNFLYSHPLGQDVWFLHMRRRGFIEGTIQNWMPNSLSDGFARPAQGTAAARNQTRSRMQKALKNQLGQK